MTTELEQEFFKVFGVEPKNKCGKDLIYPNCLNPDKCGYDNCIYYQIEYPDITAEKLLEMICIYNSFQNDEASLLIPFDINNVKDIALQVITKSIKDKSLNNYYCNDVEKLKAKIQQLFKEG